MRRVFVFGAVACLALLLAVPVYSQAPQTSPVLLQGTQVKLSLLTGLSTSVTREGDPFIAAVTEPVYLGDQLILPAGTRVMGEVGSVEQPKRFSWFRGKASLALYIRAIEMEGREIPAPMSILAIYDGSADRGKKRGDLKTVEGVLVERKHDVGGDLKVIGLGSGGGTVVGAIFSHAMRGLVFGLAGSTGYVMIRKGKDVELPAQSTMLVRVDGSVTLPAAAQATQPYISGHP
jgi:hypothetical protein